MSLKSMVTSEKISTSQATTEPKNVIRMSAFIGKMKQNRDKISQSENWLYKYRKRSLARKINCHAKSLLEAY